MALRALLLGLALLAIRAQAADTLFLDELTSPELRDRIQAGKTTILVPIGGTEQNGAHMVLGKHNVRVKKLSERIASELGDALVAPVIAYAPEPEGHMRFPGTITVLGETFERVLESAARSFRRHGFRDIVFLGDSGDYQRHVKTVAARLNREWAKAPARAHHVEAYYRAAGIREHAGAADTSLAMALDPNLVRKDRLPPETSAEAGQRTADRIVTRTVDAIRQSVRR